jgi:acyl dehydratase
MSENPDRTSPVVGDALPTLTRTIKTTDIIAYAGATWDWHRVHYDREFLEAKRIKAPIVDGQELGAILAESIQDWLGPEAFITRLHFRFAAMVYAGESVTCHGTVTEVSGNGITLELSMSAGEDSHLVLSPAGAEVTWR